MKDKKEIQVEDIEKLSIEKRRDSSDHDLEPVKRNSSELKPTAS